MHLPPYRIKNMVPGMIMLWHGHTGNVPSGWHICDGTMGTPDLRDKFVISCGPYFPPTASGGEWSHMHDFTGDGHTHAIIPGPDIQAGNDYDNITYPESAVGTTDAAAHLPPYFSVCYIMKL